MNWAYLGRLAIAAGFFITFSSFIANAEEIKGSAPSSQVVYNYGHTIYMGGLNVSQAFAFLADKSAYIKTLADSIVTKSFNNVGVYYNLAKASHPMTEQVRPSSFNSTKPMIQDESDTRNKFSFAIDDKIKLIVNLTSQVSIYAGYQVSYITGLALASDQLNFQTVPPLSSPAESLGVQLNKKFLYHGPSIELMFRW
ncbi:MAG: hypothetical protein ABSB22_13975 [Thermodesulfobacteriota bacterium]